MRKIYYLGYYDSPDNIQEQRAVTLSATNKMTYIVDALEESGYFVELISCSHTLGSKRCPEKIVSIGTRSELRLFNSLPWGNRTKRILSRTYTRTQFRRYILDNIHEDDIVIAYHSVSYASFLAEAKKKNKFKLILEVEEIYADVSGRERDRKKEYRAFQAADAFVFPTELLHEKINVSNKPYVVIHGTYQVEEDKKCRIFKEENPARIHCVYAGTFDPRKGGATAAAAAEYLSSDYHIHILGFGSESETKRMKEIVADLSKKCECGISFDGCLAGEEYIEFIQSCDIGFSTQNPDADFNATSFPSKILSYMANGLRVVSIRIPAIENSAIGEYMHFYDEQTPEEIAKAVRSVIMTDDYDGRDTVAKLSIRFIHDLDNLLVRVRENHDKKDY